MSCAIALATVLFFLAIFMVGFRRGIERVSPAQVRLPVPTESHARYAFNGVAPLEANRAEFEVSISTDSILEVGLARIDNTHSYWGYPGKYRFRAYEKNLFRNRSFVDTVLTLRMNECARFQFDCAAAGPNRSGLKIIYEVKKEETGSARGYEAFRDFAFLDPAVFGKRKPGEYNVLLISFDTLRPDHLGYNGYHRDTSPNIDRFAEANITFTEAISPAPWTSPAHYSIFTALNPSAYIYRSAGGDDGKNLIEHVVFLPARTLAEILRANGYYTVAVTGGGLVGTEFGFGSGFNIYWEYNSYGNADSVEGPWVEDNDTGKIFDRASDWLRRNHEKKFFMFLHHYECHIPYENTYFASEETSESLIQRRKALYDGDIRVADGYFGKLMQTLESLDLLSNTIIVFLSDHGEDFYDHYTEADIVPEWKEPLIPQISIVDHAHSLYEELIRVPLILRIPGEDPPRKTIDNQVRLIDVMPTILDILNIDYDGPTEGESLLGLIRTGTRDVDPPALSEFTQLGPERKSVRQEGYKYIWIENPEQCWNFNFRNIQPRELFDLRSDPAERTNVSERDKTRATQYHRLLERENRKSSAIRKALLQRQAVPHGKPEFDEETVEQLKALGYLK